MYVHAFPIPNNGLSLSICGMPLLKGDVSPIRHVSVVSIDGEHVAMIVSSWKQLSSYALFLAISSEEKLTLTWVNLSQSFNNSSNVVWECSVAPFPVLGIRHFVARFARGSMLHADQDTRQYKEQLEKQDSLPPKKYRGIYPENISTYNRLRMLLIGHLGPYLQQMYHI